MMSAELQKWHFNIEIHYDVDAGNYRNQLKFEKGETLMSPTIPDLTLKVDDIIA